MQNYIALLRGINVSGQKLIKMEDLRKWMHSAGYKNVRTYIQSGNLLVRSDQKERESEMHIAEVLKKKTGHEISVIIRNEKDWQNMINKSPFLRKPEVDPNRLYVTFLESEPSASQCKLMEDISFPGEAFVMAGKQIYLKLENGYGNARLNNGFFENKLKLRATSRNWNSILKLSEMVSGE